MCFTEFLVDLVLILIYFGNSLDHDHVHVMLKVDVATDDAYCMDSMIAQYVNVFC